ncbi:MAG: DUF1801 domain-containing protein [Nocardioides sp.]|uniref:iron chaperone n=1 Tax=Nocardioides sp. TaxID=35761 RepID=UPI0039E32A25
MIAPVHAEYLATIENEAHRAKLADILDWISTTWAELEAVVKWKQPMFTHHGTFIIGFSVFAKNIAVSPEDAGMERFREAIHAAGYTTTLRLFRIRWDDPVDHDLLREMIEWQLADKAELTSFWRP